MKTAKTKEKLVESIFKMMEKYKIEEYEDENGFKIKRKSLDLDINDFEKEKEFKSVKLGR